MDHIIIHNLKKLFPAVLPLPFGRYPLDDLNIAIGKTFDLPLPLILQARRTNDEHLRDPKAPGHDLAGGDGLDGFTQTHLVGDKAAPRGSGKKHAFPLIGIQIRFKQRFPPGIARLLWKHLPHAFPPHALVPDIGNKFKRVIMVSHIILQGACLFYKPVEIRESLRRQIMIFIEEISRQRLQALTAFPSGRKGDFSL